MKKITSLFDFFQKVKTDKRYEEVARYAYTYNIGTSPTRFRYVDAERWIKEWIKNNESDTCKAMVLYLNECMVKIYPSEYEDLELLKNLVEEDDCVEDDCVEGSEEPEA
jgi:hypothetical protein